MDFHLRTGMIFWGVLIMSFSFCFFALRAWPMSVFRHMLCCAPVFVKLSFFCFGVMFYESLYAADIPSELIDYQEHHGSPPDEAVLFSYVANLNNPETVKAISRFIFESQQPIISQEDLALIVRAKQRSIRSHECSFFVSVNEFANPREAIKP